ncbi:TPA: hypothetical protein ACH3X1_011398 [Trebouxia sp. C0004]
MVSMRRMVIFLTYLFGDLWMPRDGLMIHTLCQHTHLTLVSTLLSLCTCAGSCPCQQARQAASEQGSQLFLELIRAEFVIRSIVYSIVLFGVDSTKHLLHDVNM